MIVSALPSTGKSWLTRHYVSVFDGDGLQQLVVGDFGKEAYDVLVAHSELGRPAAKIAQELARQGLFVTNFTLDGLEADYYVGYRPNEYIEHIKLSGRSDLIEAFGEQVLRGWAASYAELGSFDNVVLLEAHEFLIDGLRAIPELRPFVDDSLRVKGDSNVVAFD